MTDEDLRVRVSVSIYGNRGTHLELTDETTVEAMSFDQLARPLSAFHTLTQAVKSGRNVTINGQEVRYY